jgi:hypothetical protein
MRCCATQGSPLWGIEYYLNPANVTIWKHERVGGCFVGFEGSKTAKLAMNKSSAHFLRIAFTLNPKSCTDPIREIAH